MGLRMASLGRRHPKTAPGSGSCPCVEPFFRLHWWLPVFGFAWSDSLGRLHEPPVCGGSRSHPWVVAPWTRAPEGSPQPPGVVPHAYLVWSEFFGHYKWFFNLLEYTLGRVRLWNVFSWFVASLANQYTISHDYIVPLKVVWHSRIRSHRIQIQQDTPEETYY